MFKSVIQLISCDSFF